MNVIQGPSSAQYHVQGKIINELTIKERERDSGDIPSQRPGAVFLNLGVREQIFDSRFVKYSDKHRF
jgi:hypothetical protein